MGISALFDADHCAGEWLTARTSKGKLAGPCATMKKSTTIAAIVRAGLRPIFIWSWLTRRSRLT